MISIVIRCYNEQEHIGRLLAGIEQQAQRDLETILVDSGSTDATLAIASHYPVKALSIQPEEFSFGRSLNVGCRAARGELIVIASAHTYPTYEDWLERLLAPFADPKVALVYGKQRGNEATSYSEHQLFARWFPNESNADQGHPFCNNANATIRRSLWEQHPYDETITGLEDLDWAQRVTALGYKIAYAADAEVVHVHQEPPRRLYNRYRREAIALAHISPQERFSLLDFARLFTTNVTSDYRQAGQDRALWSNLVNIPMFRLMQFWGTYQGFAQHKAVTSELKRTFYYPNSRAGSGAGTASDQGHRRINYGAAPAKQPVDPHD